MKKFNNNTNIIDKIVDKVIASNSLIIDILVFQLKSKSSI